ncbi:SIR2 family NAD-dependent protein deacylase [Leptospira sp. GIMC2001]|uniref:SIR2 family NAD-dependent protein deacylase n=1 Tax=Leptospira sp. GIMC2001 TaxID=1513297 RepID=UPI003FA56997
MVAIKYEKFKPNSRIAVLTGAGISAESGIPTFRGEGGLWRNFSFEELATPAAFQKDPVLVWEWYNMRRDICGQSEPNPGHEAIAELESIFSEFHLFTQNVDNLHARAGSKKITELHGNIFIGRCLGCNKLTPLPISNKISNKNSIQNLNENEGPPICDGCSNMLRPHILWFGESYDTQMLDQAAEFLSKSDIIFVIGTSGNVSVPVQLANLAINNGAYSIEINPEPSSLSKRVDISIRAKSGEALPEILKKIKSSI